MTVDPTTQPVITLTQAPSQFRETSGIMFQPNTIQLSFRVDYSQYTVLTNAAGKLSTVLKDMRDQNYQIYRGRALALGGVPSPSPLVPYGGYFPASLNATEMSGVPNGVAPTVTNINGALVPGALHIWQVDVTLTMIGYNNLNEQPHATVTTQAAVRMASAYRTDPDLKLLTDAGSPNLGSPTQGSVFTTGPCATNSNARVGTYDKDNWITYLKSTMDCGGVKVDLNGQPVPIAIEQLHHTMQFIIRRPNYGEDIIPGGPASPSGAGTRYTECMFTLWGRAGTWLLNKRNAEVLFGYSPGTLLCTAVSTNVIDDEYMMCNVTLTWDEWAHCDQAPWGFSGNVPPTAESTASSGTPDRPILNADTVYWINPYAECFNFASADFPYGAYDMFNESIYPQA